MQGMIDMALLPIEELTGKKKYTENHLTTTVLINCICSAQTHKHKRATMRRRVGAQVQKKMLG
jgi:hypothetical protein